MTTLQKMFLNNLGNEKANSLYFHIKNGFYRNTSRDFQLFSGGIFDTNTYFNSFPIEFYLKHTSVRNIFLNISIVGNAILKIYGIGENLKCEINEFFINNREIRTQSLAIGKSFDKTKVKYFYLEIIALDTCIIKNVEWETLQSPIRNIKLSICCTTFNRPDDVNRLIIRLSKNDDLREKSHLYIINNGDPIEETENDYFTIIQNKNTGGTGGFMRGLIEAKQSKYFTHVMFIDDDAFCEPLSILKAITILEYAKSNNDSIAGAMLYLDRPWIQYEAGASLKEFNIESNHPNLDLREESNLIENLKTRYCEYGPWWFFVFPIKKDLKFSFPFFVRGDDVTFSLRNEFKPFLVNGICSWQESFDAKISPSVEYLAFRSFIMFSLLYVKEDISSIKLFKYIFSHILRELLGYRYSIANALCQSLIDVEKGPDFWKEHVEMGKRLKQIVKISGSVECYDSEISPAIYSEPYVKVYQKIFASITFFGHIFPNIICKKGVCVLGLSARPYSANGKKYIEQYSPENNKVFRFKKKNKLFFELLFKSIYLSGRICLKKDKLRKAYNNSLSNFESIEFWKESLK